MFNFPETFFKMSLLTDKTLQRISYKVLYQITTNKKYIF